MPAGVRLAGERPRGRPRDAALQQRRREQILAEATAVFAEHGYPGTDVQFIADPLGISKGTVYRYFPTKEELFLAAVERGVLRLKEHMERRVETVADPVERIAVAIRSHLEFFRSDPQLVELFIQERAEFRDQRQPIYFEHGEANCGRWRRPDPRFDRRRAGAAGPRRAGHERDRGPDVRDDVQEPPDEPADPFR